MSSSPGTEPLVLTEAQQKLVILTVPGRPQAKERPRFDSRTGRVYTDQRTQSAEAILQGFMREVCWKPLEGPLELGVTFCFHRPNSWSKAKREAVDDGDEEPWYTGKPDVDNLIKTVMDAAKLILWKDDAQVVSVSAYKVYSAESQTVINVFPAR